MCLVLLSMEQKGGLFHQRRCLQRTDVMVYSLVNEEVVGELGIVPPIVTSSYSSPTHQISCQMRSKSGTVLTSPKSSLRETIIAMTHKVFKETPSIQIQPRYPTAQHCVEKNMMSTHNGNFFYRKERI